MTASGRLSGTTSSTKLSLRFPKFFRVLNGYESSSPRSDISVSFSKDSSQAILHTQVFTVRSSAGPEFRAEPARTHQQPLISSRPAFLPALHPMGKRVMLWLCPKRSESIPALAGMVEPEIHRFAGFLRCRKPATRETAQVKAIFLSSCPSHQCVSDGERKAKTTISRHPEIPLSGYDISPQTAQVKIDRGGTDQIRVFPERINPRQALLQWSTTDLVQPFRIAKQAQPERTRRFRYSRRRRRLLSTYR